MNRNRSTHLPSKQASISSISSHIPLMTTSQNSETHLLTQSMINKNATADVHNLLQISPLESTRELKRSRTVFQPKGTISYTVDNTDTIEKVALRFNSTPSELLKLNKLNTRVIFPGQTLFVPEHTADEQQPTTAISPPPSAISPSAPTNYKDGEAFILLTDRRLSSELTSSHHQSQQDVGPMVWSMARQSTARPGRVERLKSDPSTESEPSSSTIEDRSKTEQKDHSNPVKPVRKSVSVDENPQLDEDCLQRFIKLNVRLTTEDRQSVGGTLLVTPNAVMFDPDVLDPLIKEHGIDKYGLIIRMNVLAGIALYEDLAMYEHEATSRDEEKRKMYRSISVQNSHHNQLNTPLNTDEQQIHDLMSSLLDKIDKEFNPSISTDTCCMLFNASSPIQHHLSMNSSDDKTFLPISSDDNFVDDLFEPLDDYKHSIGILLNDNNDDKQNFNRIPSQGSHLENHVSLDQFTKRFKEIDKLLQQQQQNYLLPHPIEIPYYLCLRTSMHTHDIPSLHPKQYKRDSEKNIENVYGKKQLESEYWFSVPKDKIDQLYKFFLHWTPERELDPLSDDDIDQLTTLDPSKYNNTSPNRGFVLLATDDPELTDDYSKNQIKKNEQQKKSHYLKQQNTLLKEWEIK